jgi:hypothetical protein
MVRIAVATGSGNAKTETRETEAAAPVAMGGFRMIVLSRNAGIQTVETMGHVQKIKMTLLTLNASARKAGRETHAKQQRPPSPLPSPIR